MKKALFVVTLILLTFIACTVSQYPASSLQAVQDDRYVYDIPVKGKALLTGIAENSETLQEILEPYFSYELMAAQIFSGIPVDQPLKYAAIFDAAESPEYIVFETDKLHHTVIDLKDVTNITFNKIKKEITEREQIHTFTINGSMLDMVNIPDADSSVALLTDVVDFYDLKEGDKVTVAYSQKFAGDNFLYISRIKGIKLEGQESEEFAYLFSEGGQLSFFSEDGKKLTPRFYDSPLEYSRISSRFSLTRRHPVTKRVKPHYGTDFAAPIGTPIWAAGDGVVIRKARSRGNGNFVIIKHDDTYKTQYLHMSKFATGLKVGQKVQKGDVIGYVGKTGLASGPHLCFRFWVNDIQVDPFKEKEHIYEKLSAEHVSEFKKVKQEIKQALNSVT